MIREAARTLALALAIYLGVLMAGMLVGTFWLGLCAVARC